ncbi:hypothetical protein BDV93DRAFT_131989 [Ceratobasidium sp. AG-I]|nr:hypothetical protein BDV93DRAFT_131989 [Ceratobasidium sp. AG-I]
MIAAYTKLVTQLPQLFGNRTSPHSPKMVIAIDEAHDLNQVVETHFRPSHILCKVISAFNRAHSEVSNWVVFVSTDSKVADFSAPSYIHPSHRVSQGGERLFPPYVLLGWDQMVPKLQDLNLEPQDVARFRHIAGYGRPLWSSLMAALVPADIILETACEKLCGSRNFDPTRPMQALAILGQRCFLEPKFGHRGAISYQQNSVAGYMRICTDTTENGTWQETAYPSEPVLSCAASLLLHAKPDIMASSLRCLMKEISSGLIDTGKHGELVSRLLLLLAKDLCARQLDLDLHTARVVGDDWNKELLDCRPLLVVEYLEFLFGNRVDESAKKQFDHWYIDFSHWAPMVESIQASPEHLRLEDCITRHWYRTTALQCCHDQPWIDKVIPMYYIAPPSKTKSKAKSTPLPPTQPKQQPGRGVKPVSYILISDRANGDTKSSLNCITPKSALQATTGQPYIAIYLDLRISGKAPNFTFVPKSSTDSASLRIYAPGLNTKTYPFLKAIPDTMSLLEGMLHPPVNLKYSCAEHAHLRNQFKCGATCRPSHMRQE